MKFSHIMILFVVLAAFGLMAFAPLQDGSPPVATAPADYAGFVASAGLIVVAVAFAKQRLGLSGPAVLWAGVAIVAAIAFYPDVIALLPVAVAGVVNKLVFGVVLPFVAGTGSYDFLQNGVIAKLKS